MSIDQLTKREVWVIVRRILVFAGISAVLLTGLDALHVVFGVRTIGTQPWLTPVKFAVVGALLAFVSFILDARPHRARIFSTCFYGLVFSLSYAATALLPASTELTLLLVAAAVLQVAVMLGVTRGPIELVETVPFAVLLSTMGPLAEYIDVKLGGFSYRGTTGIPGWLPLLWGNGAFFVRALVGSTKGRAHVIAWLITAIAPIARFIAMLWYVVPKIRERGLRGAWNSGLRLYGFSKD